MAPKPFAYGSNVPMWGPIPKGLECDLHITLSTQITITAESSLMKFGEQLIRYDTIKH